VLFKNGTAVSGRCSPTYGAKLLSENILKEQQFLHISTLLVYVAGMFMLSVL
jgi:hypothetical protein